MHFDTYLLEIKWISTHTENYHCFPLMRDNIIKGKEISSQIMMDSDEEEDADDLKNDDGDESEVEVNDGNNEEQSENNDNAGDDESMEY